MPENYFGARVASRCAESVADLFEPAAVEPVVDFSAEIARGGAAAMTLGERWGGWEREPFTSESVEHVSVWSGRRRVRGQECSLPHRRARA